MSSLIYHTNASLKGFLTDRKHVSLKGLLLGRDGLTSMELMEDITDLIGSLFPGDSCYSAALIKISKVSFQSFVRDCRGEDNIDDPGSAEIVERSFSNYPEMSESSSSFVSKSESSSSLSEQEKTQPMCQAESQPQLL